MNINSNCTVCGTPLRGRQQKYCSKACKNRALQSYSAQKKRGLARKLLLVKALGGQCSVCGYDRNLAALVFHHSESGKDFKLDMRSLSNRTWDKVLAEAEKCVLLCRNCHAELHNAHLDLAHLTNEAGRSNH
jgi:predicted nucleic acid-binding Zn ribbon protein